MTTRKRSAKVKNLKVKGVGVPRAADPRSLIERAMEVSVQRRPKVATTEDLELALAYIRGELQLRQVAAAVNRNGNDSHPGNATHWLGRVLVSAVRSGWLIEAPGARRLR